MNRPADEARYRAGDETGSAEDVGLNDFKFGVIGLGMCAVWPSCSRSSSRRPWRRSEVRSPLAVARRGGVRASGGTQRLLAGPHSVLKLP